jgi:hypothetical protein
VDGLADVVGRFPLSEEPLLSEDVEEGALPDFEDEVQVLVLLVELVQLQAVLVLEVELDLDLRDETLYEPWRHLLEADLLGRVDRAGEHVDGEVHVAEAALAQHLAQPELLAEGAVVPHLAEDARALGLLVRRQVFIGGGEDVELGCFGGDGQFWRCQAAVVEGGVDREECLLGLYIFA